MHGHFNGAKAALFVGTDLLCILRDDLAHIPFPAHWDFPGGGREGDETPKETVIRETREEVGLDITSAEWLWARPFPANHTPDAIVWFFVVRMPALAVSDIILGDEGQSWRLVPEARLPQLTPIVPSLPERLKIWRASVGE